MDKITSSWVTISEQLDFMLTRNNIFVEVLVERFGYEEISKLNKEVEKRMKKLNLKVVK